MQNGVRLPESDPISSSPGERRKAAALVEVHSPIAFLLRPELFGLDAPFLRRRRRLRLATLFGHMKRVADQCGQSFVRRHAMLSLAAMVTRHDANHAVGIEPRGEFRAQSFALFVANGS